MKNKKTRKGDLKTEQMIASFMSASSPIESYLQQGNPLTNHQVELISLTISGLQTFLDSWKRKHGTQPIINTFLDQYVTKKRPTKEKS